MKTDDRLLVRIGSDPRILFGKPAIRGTRIAVEHVLQMLAAGMTQQEVLDSLEGLEQDDIKACLTYAYHYVSGDLVYGAVAFLDEGRAGKAVQ